jgi:uncharacterized protein (DUF58 family)
MLRLIPFLLALFLIAALLRVDFFFTLAYLFFAVYVLSRLWGGRALPQLTIKREFVRRAFHGDEVPVTVTLRNDGRLPVTWVQARESLSVELGVPARQNHVFSLNPREAHSLSYTLQCRKRGVYALGPLQVRSGDLFGLTPLAGAEAPPDRLIVYPRVVPLEKLNLPTRSPLAALSARTPLFEDPARVVGVRDYVPGDSQRRIHWTATASAGRLLVKNYQPAIARETVICLDLNAESYDIRGRYDAIELAITAAASVANHVIVRERQPAGLITEARDKLTDAAARFVLPAQAGRAHLMNVLEALARAQFTQGRSFAQFVRQESVHLGWGTTLVIITGHEAPLLDTLAQLRQAGFPVALILVQAARPSAATRQRAAVLRIPVYPLWRERDLESLM